MCSSARRASSGPMVFLVIAKDSELMVAVLDRRLVVCLLLCSCEKAQNRFKVEVVEGDFRVIGM
jgi:hypothetical protein